MNNNDKEVEGRLDSYLDELIKDSKTIPGLVGRLVISESDIFRVISEAQPAAESKTVFPKKKKKNKTQKATPMRSKTNNRKPKRVSSSLKKKKKKLPPNTLVRRKAYLKTAGPRRNKKFTSKKKGVGGGKTKTKGEKMSLNTFWSRTPSSVIRNNGIGLHTELSSSKSACAHTRSSHLGPIGSHRDTPVPCDDTSQTAFAWRRSANRLYSSTLTASYFHLATPPRWSRLHSSSQTGQSRHSLPSWSRCPLQNSCFPPRGVSTHNSRQISSQTLRATLPRIPPHRSGRYTHFRAPHACTHMACGSMRSTSTFKPFQPTHLPGLPWMTSLCSRAESVKS